MKGVNQLVDEYGESSDSSDGGRAPGETIDFQEMSLEEQNDYENPIEAFQRGGGASRGSRANSSIRSTDYASSINADSLARESPHSSGSVTQQQQLNNLAVEIDIKETIIQGSFLPVTVMALAGKFPINTYVIDPQQGAKLVHYIGTFGKVKTLKTFISKFAIDLAAQDKNGQTIVHYAARKGQLQMLKYLREIGPAYGVGLEMENSYGLTPIVYAMINNQLYTFVYLFFKMRCSLTAERASWTATQLVKQQCEDVQLLNLLFNDVNLGDEVAQTVLDASVEHQNTDTLEAVLKHLFHSNRLSENHLTNLLEETTADPVVTDMLERYLAKVVVKSRGLMSVLLSPKRSRCGY